MKNRIIIPAEIIYRNVRYTDDINKWLKNHYHNGKSYYNIIIGEYGVYLIHNKIENKYYVGSTQSYYQRHLTLGHDSCWRVRVARTKFCYFMNENNIKDFELILLPNKEDTESRLKRETRYIRFLQSYKPEYGYNICKNSKGGNGTGGHRWVTNNDIDLLIKIEDPTPDGFFPGQKRQSWVRNFFEKYNWDWRLRNPNSEEIILKFKDRRELLSCTNARTLKAGSRYIASLIRNLDYLYNIKIVFG